MAKKNQPDQRAATMGAGFTGLPHVVQDSPAYASLGFYARAILMQLLRRFNGYNNGRVAVSQRQLAVEIGSTNYRKIGEATAELMDRGLIHIAAEGQWKQRHAREFTLTFVSTGDEHRHVAATNDYKRWTPTEAFSGADTVSAGNANLLTTHQQAPRNAADGVSAEAKWPPRKAAVFSKVAADDASTLICKPYPEGREGDGYHIYPLNAAGLATISTCGRCGSGMHQSNVTKRYCSERCRKAAESKRRYQDRKQVAA